MTEKQHHQFTWDLRLEEDCRAIIQLAVREDLDRSFDWTTVALVDSGQPGHAAVVARRAGVIAGLPAAKLALAEYDADLKWSPQVADGDTVKKGQSVAEIRGAARSLLTSERVVLNLLARLSGVATLTRQYVEAVQGTQAGIYDTRKTTPGWRRLEKYAVKIGGGHNHRTGLFDAVLIKDNHLAVSKQRGTNTSITSADALARVKQLLRQQPAGGAEAEMIVEVEVDTLAQLAEVLPAGPDVVLLDNMTPNQLRSAVRTRAQIAPDVQLEASGGITLSSVREVALTGVERISVGALTHAAVSLDLALDWLPA